MRVLMLSVDPNVATGYGQISKRIIETFKEIPDIELRMVSYYGSKHKTQYEGIDIYPAWGGFVGDSSVIAQCKTWKPDLLLTTFDLFVCKPTFFREVKKHGVKIASMLMVDSMPYQYPNMEPLRLVDYPIVVTEQALNQIPKDIANIARYIPLSVDSAYHIIDKNEARYAFNELIGADLLDKDTQLTTVVSANVGDEHGRKNFYGIIKGWKLHLEQTGVANKYLYLHTDVRGISANGTDLKLMMMTLKYTAEQAATIIFPNQMEYLDNVFTVENMNCIYSASDVYLNPSQGEGFGMPICESIACGCYPLVTNFGASKELIEKTKINHHLHLLQGEDIYVGNNAVRCHVTPQTIANALTAAYSNPILQDALGYMKCQKEYSYDAQIQKWEDLINNIKED